VKNQALPHAVSRLRAERLARSAKPFLARGGPRGERCAGCRLVPSHCLCALRPSVPTRAGVCLLMADIEPLKPSNTGWLIADVVADTFAFGWARTEVDPALLALLADPQWQPYVVFPGEFVAAERVVTQLTECNEGPQFPAGPPQGELAPPGGSDPHSGGAWGQENMRPLFILLDATWPEARKMFRKSPYLNHLPVLSLHPDQLSRYKLRRSRRDDHFCTSEVAALCLDLAGETHAAQMLEAYLDVFTHHYLQAKRQLPADMDDAAHQRLSGLATGPQPFALLPIGAWGYGR
jgi:DTW domain-containing protein YfiP